MRFLPLLLLFACSGTTGGSDTSETDTPSTGACRESVECASGEYCFAPGEPNCPVEQSCSQSTCPTNQDCLAADPAFDPCAAAVCRDRCTDDAGCRAGTETCDLTTSQCVPIPCDGGFTCGAHETCTPGAPLHGCVRDACADDAGCSGGTCVKALCYDALGLCGYQAEN